MFRVNNSTEWHRNALSMYNTFSIWFLTYNYVDTIFVFFPFRSNSNVYVCCISIGWRDGYTYITFAGLFIHFAPHIHNRSVHFFFLSLSFWTGSATHTVGDHFSGVMNKCMMMITAWRLSAVENRSELQYVCSDTGIVSFFSHSGRIVVVTSIRYYIRELLNVQCKHNNVRYFAVCRIL